MRGRGLTHGPGTSSAAQYRMRSFVVRGDSAPPLASIGIALRLLFCIGENHWLWLKHSILLANQLTKPPAVLSAVPNPSKSISPDAWTTRGF